MAYAIRWVKEIFSLRPALCSAALRLRRRSSSTATDNSRNVVAVGTVRLSFMLATSLAAGPLIGVVLDAGKRVSGSAAREGAWDLLEGMLSSCLPSSVLTCLPAGFPF